MNKSETIGALTKALAKAQGELENASKTSNNPRFESKYADLAEIINTVRPVFAKHGLAVVQMPSFDSGIAHVETMLTHESGEYIANTCSAPVGKQDAQGVGSAITYLRRYSLAAFAGIAQEDDDGNASVGKKPASAPVTRHTTKEKLTAGRFSAALDAVRSGNSSADVIRARFELTTEQDNELHALTQELAQC